jgi:arylsulfatase A-like enzyme
MNATGSVCGRRVLRTVLAMTAALWLGGEAAQAQQAWPDRTTLPVTPPPFSGSAAHTLDGSRPAWTPELRPPPGAPNILLILVDDAGFGNPSTFGGPVATPTLDALAHDGLRYDAFHVTALCSPTRAALLTGRNQHSVGFGSIAELTGGWPGYDAHLPRTAATVARILQGNGYSTAAFGKWHLTPPTDFGPAGPFDRWPRGQGFDYFWGFLGAETDQYQPLLFENDRILGTPTEKNFEFNVAMADHAIAWLKDQVSTAPDRPFFIYYATGASHAPHQVTPEWSAKYRGRFDQGWDKLREDTFERQKSLGVIPPDAALTPRNEAFPAWDSLSPDVKALAARQMEVYAGYQEETDHEIGRVIQEIDDLGRHDNTLVLYIFGDNGASMEGTETGTFNEMVVLNGIPLTQDQQLAAIKAYGGLSVWGEGKIEPHYAAAWAWAGNTPFQWGKQVASHLGGTRDPLVIRWPQRAEDKGGLRSQFIHVTDIAPTLLDAAGVPVPELVDGVKQMPMAGVSFLPTLGDAKAPSRHTQQYFEVLGNRAMYKDGWWLGCRLPRIPWKVDLATLARFAPGRWNPDADPCELYDLTHDFSQAHDLASANPDKVAELRKLFWEEAERYQVLPLLGSMASIFGDAYQKPEPPTQRFEYQPTVQNLSPGVIPQIYNRSFAIDADLVVERNDCILVVCSGAEGVIVAEGDYLGGFSLYVMHGRPRFTYSFLGLKIDTIEGQDALPTGPVKLRYEFTADKPGAKAGGGLGRLLVNGREVAQGRIEHTVPGQFTSYAGMDIGRDNGLPVVPELLYAFERPFPAQAKIRTVAFELN